MVRRNVSFVMWSVPLVLLAGINVSCSDGRRPVFPVQGQVLFEDKPTPGAMVIFHPVNDPDPRAPRPIARIGADGTFKPTTYATGDGAPAGTYDVTVTWIADVDNQNVSKEDYREPKNGVPDIYGKPDTAGLRIEIKKAPNDLTPFRLTRK
jgi:hypothetical protein